MPQSVEQLQLHLETLKKKHTDLENKLSTLKQHPSIDSLQVRELKRQKLSLKEEIVAIERKIELQAEPSMPTP